MTPVATDLQCQWWTDTTSLVLVPERDQCMRPIRQREAGPCEEEYVYDTVAGVNMLMRCDALEDGTHHDHRYNPGYVHVDPEGPCAICGKAIPALPCLLHEYVPPEIELDHEAVA